MDPNSELQLEYDDDIQSLSASISTSQINNVDLNSPNQPHVGHVYSSNYTHSNSLSNESNSNNTTPEKVYASDNFDPSSLRQNMHLNSTNVTDVYELAAAIGNSMEPLLAEFGQEKMEKLTKEIVRTLESFEKTVNLLTKETENSLEYQYKLEKSKHELSLNKKSHEKEVLNLDRTIDQLTQTIESLQVSHDTLVDNFDWDDILRDSNVDPSGLGDPEYQNKQGKNKLQAQASKTELQLAKKLRLETEKSSKLEALIDSSESEINRLNKKLKKIYKKYPELDSENAENLTVKSDSIDAACNTDAVENSSGISSAFNTENEKLNDSNLQAETQQIEVKEDREADTVALTEFQKVLRDKNFYKEKCFTMEDQLMEYKMMLANYELSQAGAISGLSTPKKETSRPKPTQSRLTQVKESAVAAFSRTVTGKDLASKTLSHPSISKENQQNKVLHTSITSNNFGSPILNHPNSNLSNSNKQTLTYQSSTPNAQVNQSNSNRKIVNKTKSNNSVLSFFMKESE